MARSTGLATYPRWIHYPRWSRPDQWAIDLVEVFRRANETNGGLHGKSDDILGQVRVGLEGLGYRVEGGAQEPTIKRPVHFGEQGMPSLSYQIDSYHPDLKVGLEVEAGRSTRGNAIYRDIIQTALLVDIEYFAIAVPQRYSFKSGGKGVTDDTYEMCKGILDAVYSTSRILLPFRGVLLLGY